MKGKFSHTVGEYTTVSAIIPTVALFTMLVPSTGSIYWSESSTGQLSTLLSKSDLSQFVVDEEIFLAFRAASNTGKLLQCRTLGPKLASSCSQAKTKLVSIYTGDVQLCKINKKINNERVMVLFLLFESTVLALLIGIIKFCCTFWRKKKLQAKGLGRFLVKRVSHPFLLLLLPLVFLLMYYFSTKSERIFVFLFFNHNSLASTIWNIQCSLQLKKKALDRTIIELEQKAVEEAVGSEVLQKLGDIVQERESIERKLSNHL